MHGLVLTAAGSSTRFRSAEPKVFATLDGRTVLERALEAFRAALAGLRIVVTARASDLPRVRELVPDAAVVAGGATRQESVRLGVAALPADVRFAWVHDAARPLVSPALVERVRAALEVHGAVLPALPVGDSLHRVAADESRLERAEPRAGLVAAQTPQAARIEWLREALERASAAGFDATDEAGLLLWAGRAVHVVEGEPTNLKLTRAADLTLAEALAAALRKP